MRYTEDDPSDKLIKFLESKDGFKLVATHKEGDILVNDADASIMLIEHDVDVYTYDNAEYRTGVFSEYFFDGLDMSITTNISQVNITNRYELDVERLVALYTQAEITHILDIQPELFDFNMARYTDFPLYITNNKDLFPDELKVIDALTNNLKLNESQYINLHRFMKIMRKFTIYS